MKKLIVLRGNSGNGKTTIAKVLQKRFGDNTMVISQDFVRRDMLKVKDGADTKALPLMKLLLEYGSEHCDVVILEGIMYVDWYKSLFEVANKIYGNEICAYYFDLPFEETLLRHQTRPQSNDFGEEEMRDWWREKDFSDMLYETIITSEMDAESIVEMIYSNVLTCLKRL